MNLFVLLFVICITLHIDTLVQCKRKSGANIGSDVNYDDEADDILNQLKESIEKDKDNNDRKTNEKIKFNDDISFLEDDATKAKLATTTTTTTTKKSMSIDITNKMASPASNTFVNNHDEDTSHSWTIFFILCILGKKLLFV